MPHSSIWPAGRISKRCLLSIAGTSLFTGHRRTEASKSCPETKSGQPPVSGQSFSIQREQAALAHSTDVTFPVAFQFIEADEIDAFTLPGGHIFINTALLKLFANEAEPGQPGCCLKAGFGLETDPQTRTGCSGEALKCLR